MKKIFSIILTLTLLMQSVLTVSAEEDVKTFDKEYAGLLEYIGISAKDSEDTPVSRGEFVSMTLKLVGIDANSVIPEDFEGQFVDVDKDCQWYNDIAYAYEYGIITGYTSEYFSPDETISVNEALKILLGMLNFDIIAENAGGYPTGYYATASNIGLLDGVTKTGELTKFNAFALLYNALNVGLAEIGFGGDGSITYTINEENTLLSQMDMYVEEGVLTAYGYFSAYPSDKCEDMDHVEINRVSFEYTGNDLPVELLGQYVKAYIDNSDDENTVVLIEKNERYNTVTEIDYNDVTDIDTAYVRYESGSSEKNVKFDSSVSVMINNSYYGSVESAITNSIFDNYTKLLLIDNNRNGKTDFINVIKTQYMVVQTVYPADGIMVFANDKGSLDTMDEDIITKVTKDEMSFDVSMVLQNDVVMINKSELVSGKVYYEIDVARKPVTGKLNEIREENNKLYYKIDDTLYEITSEYEEYLETNITDVKPSLGDTAVFYLSTDDKIVYSEVRSGSNYAYLMKLIETDENGEYQVFANLYTTDKTSERYELSDKVTVYSDEYYTGKRLEKDDCYRYISYVKTYEYGLIMYELNTEEKISKIVIPIDTTQKTEPGMTDYPLTLDFNKTRGASWDAEFWVYFRVLGYKYMLTSVPAIYAPIETDAKNDADRYIVKSATEFGSDYMFPEGTVVKLYNVDEFYTPSLLVIESSAGANANIDPFLNVSVVSSVEKALNSDDSEAIKMKYVSCGKEEEAFLKTDAEIIISDSVVWTGTEGMTIDDIGPGDILQITKDIKGDIDYIRVLFRNTNRGEYRTQANDGSTEGFSSLAIVYGKVLKKGDSAVLVTAENNVIRPMFLTTNYGTKYYTLVDTTKKNIQVSAISLDDIRNGDEVVVRKRYNEACEFIVYR